MVGKVEGGKSVNSDKSGQFEYGPDKDGDQDTKDSKIPSAPEEETNMKGELDIVMVHTTKGYTFYELM